VAASLVERTLAEIRAGGGRVTPARRAVLAAILDTGGHHFTAAEIFAAVDDARPRPDRATVYRTIELLKKLRLIDELDLMHLQGEKHYYEVKTLRDHVHLACFQCGAIEEFSSALFERLKGEISNQAGFEVKVTRLEVGGRCRSCRDAAGRATHTEGALQAALHQ